MGPGSLSRLSSALSISLWWVNAVNCASFQTPRPVFPSPRLKRKIFCSDIPMTLSVCQWYFAASSDSHLFIPGVKWRLLVAASIKVETHRLIKNGHSQSKIAGMCWACVAVGSLQRRLLLSAVLKSLDEDMGDTRGSEFQPLKGSKCVQMGSFKSLQVA